MKTKKTSTTINDIAQKAKVSKATVSRYLNGHYEYMSENTKLRIEEVIRKEDYHPNLLARSLKTKRHKLIGIVYSDLFGPFASVHLGGLSETLEKLGYSFVIYNTLNSPEKELECLHSCISQQVSGILLRRSNTDINVYKSIVEQGTPIVMYDRYTEDWPYDMVYVDNYSVIMELLKRIESNGYEQIYWMTGYSNPVSTNVPRLQSFLNYMKSKNIDGSKFVHYFDERSENAYRDIHIELSKIMAEPSPGRKVIFADTSITLQFVLAGLKNQDISIPYQIGVCGFDMWNWSSVMNPGISAIYPPIRELATAAGQLIVERIEKGGEAERQKIVLTPSYVLRKSTERY